MLHKEQVINDNEYRYLQVNATNRSVTLSLPSKWIRELALNQHSLMKLQLVKDEADFRVIVTAMENE